MSEEEIRAKRLEIQKRWESLGFTEGLHGEMQEKIAKLFEPIVKELKHESEGEQEPIL